MGLRFEFNRQPLIDILNMQDAINRMIADQIRVSETFAGPAWRAAEPNYTRAAPGPRPGFIDARRDDGCVPVITSLPEMAA